MDSGPRDPSLADPAAWLNGKIIEHEAFMSTLLAVRRALMGSSIVLLTGVAGSGKSALAGKLVGELNQGCAHGQVRAVLVLAPATHRRAFSWKDMWTEILRKLGDPLPERKLDRNEAALRLARGGSTANLRGTEGGLQRAVRDAIKDVGVEVLVIDDAGSLLKNERGRAFGDQLDVLRNLASAVGCRVVLVATPSILKNLKLSPELERRMDEVVLERYRLTPGVEDEHRKAFQRVMATIQNTICKRGHWKVTLTKKRLQLLHDGCLGCVGTLIEWFGRALVCAGDSELRWEHLRETVVTDAKREGWRRTFKEDEGRCAKALKRSLGGEVHVSEGDEQPAKMQSMNGSEGSSKRTRSGPDKRPGVPKATSPDISPWVGAWGKNVWYR